MKGLIKDLFFLIKNRYFGLENSASILGYHSVGEEKAFFVVSPQNFEKQLAYINKCGFKVVKLSDLVRKIRGKEDITNHVVLTFKDGYKDGYEKVFPLLKKYNFPATFFITVELLDTSIKNSEGFIFKTLSVKEIKEMQESGLVEFMPQTNHRQSFNNIIFERAVSEIEAERLNVESLTGQKASIFSYPKSGYKPDFVEHLRGNGWEAAVTSEEGLVRSDTDLFSLPRNAVTRKTSFIQFKGKLSTAIEEYKKARG